MSERILVVDDEPVLRRNLVRFLKRRGRDAEGAESGEAALERLREADFGVVITDLRMPGMGGLELVRRLPEASPETLVLIMTAFASVESAVEALRLGAQDYLLKPLSLDELEHRVAALLENRAMAQRVRRLRQELHGHFDVDGIVATSPAMQGVMALVGRAARSKITVLIEGESGTGKELIARALHDSSPWAGADFIAANLAAQPAELVDAMLFGHEKGAFTGATRAREGVFRAARGGTVFLDEIGELPPAVQVKLLRVLENREVTPLGSDRPVPVDFRLVAATHRSLERMVEAGDFRQDLFFRLNVLRIPLPPLRERPDDIAPLAARFIDRHAQAMGLPAPGLSNEALRALEAHPWPGNVRELSNAVERAVLLTSGPWITPEDLPAGVAGAPAVPLALKEAMAVCERHHIRRVLALTDGDKAKAAALLEIHLATLYRHLERLGLS